MIIDRQAVRNYAEALFANAKEQGKVALVHEQAAAVIAGFEEVPEFRAFLESPNVPRADAEALLTRSFGSRVDELLLQYMLFVVRKRRVEILRDSLEVYGKLAEADAGFSRARVTSAVPLDEGQRARLQAALEAHTGLSLHIDHVVDPAVIGGLVFQCGDLLIDNSLRHHLDRLGDQLMAVKVN
jgi:F-type H+-transporting ATPase subunit delta